MAKLVNAETRAERSPTTFQIPPRAERHSLQVGDYAKVIFDDAERMWVEIIGVNPPGSGQWPYEGRLRNTPVVCLDLKFNEPVLFGPQHVIEIDRGGSKAVMTDAEERDGTIVTCDDCSDPDAPPPG